MSQSKKAPRLTLTLRRKIGKFKLKNKSATISDIAEMFNCTPNQARAACRDYAAGLLTVVAPKRADKDAEELAKETPADELFGMAYNFALAQLAASKKRDAAETIPLLEKLQKMELSAHLKRADAEIIAQIIRRFLPDASNMEVIKIYREELAKWNQK